MIRPNTELLREEVIQAQPRFVDVSKGTLTAKTKRAEAVNKATLRKKISDQIYLIDILKLKELNKLND